VRRSAGCAGADGRPGKGRDSPPHPYYAADSHLIGSLTWSFVTDEATRRRVDPVLIPSSPDQPETCQRPASCGKVLEQSAASPPAACGAGGVVPDLIDAAVKRLGISRTAWLHVAAGDLLEARDDPVVGKRDAGAARLGVAHR
jgi:hypothetical protein